LNTTSDETYKDPVKDEVSDVFVVLQDTLLAYVLGYHLQLITI